MRTLTGTLALLLKAATLGIAILGEEDLAKNAILSCDYGQKHY